MIKTGVLDVSEKHIFIPIKSKNNTNIHETQSIKAFLTPECCQCLQFNIVSVCVCALNVS